MRLDANDPEFWKNWKKRCLWKWSMAAAIVATISGLAVAMPYVKNLRPWATRHEVYVLAARIYPSALESNRLQQILVQKRISYFEQQGIKLTPEEFRTLQDLRTQLFDLRDKETQMLKERAHFEVEDAGK